MCVGWFRSASQVTGLSRVHILHARLTAYLGTETQPICIVSLRINYRYLHRVLISAIVQDESEP